MAFLRRSAATVTTRTSDSPILTAPELGTPSAAVMTNLTGTLTSPTLVTPALGTPASGNFSDADIVYPAGMITNYTRTVTTPIATQGNAQTNTDLTGSSVSYTPTPSASFVVYEYSAFIMGGSVYTLQLIHFKKDGSLVANYNWQVNLRTDASFEEHALGQINITWVGTAWSGAQTLSVVYQQWETSTNYPATWHRSTLHGRNIIYSCS